MRSAHAAPIFAALAAVGLLACGDNAPSGGDGDDDSGDTSLPDASVCRAPTWDAGPSGPCWMDTDHHDQGAITAGTGRRLYQEMPEQLPLVYGSQDGFNLLLNAQMSGLDPGCAPQVLNAFNPHTRFSAYFVDTGDPINTPNC